MRYRGFPLIVAVSLSLGCVTKATHDKVVADARARESADRAEIAKLKTVLADAWAEARARDEKIASLGTDVHNLQARLDEATAINQNLRAELERLGKDVDGILKEKGTLTDALKDAKVRLEELRRAQEAAEKRAALFRTLVEKFRKMADAGSLNVAVREGRLVLRLSADVLFDSGKTELKGGGRAALKQVAEALVGIGGIGGRRFQVAGHTDDLPIATARFPSNWELSAARATEVVKFLVAHGVKPEALSAAGYGEFDPIASNTTPESRARNRRIEITLQPSIDELVAAPPTGEKPPEK